MLLGACRRVLHGQYRAGTLDRVMYRKLDEDLNEMDLVVGGCERLFSSPAPPTMARHGVRSMFLWLLALPLAALEACCRSSLAAPVEKPVIAGPVVFVLGNDACGKEEVCTKLAVEVGGSYLSATVLLRNAVESGSDEGRKLAEMIKQGKII